MIYLHVDNEAFNQTKCLFSPAYFFNLSHNTVISEKNSFKDALFNPIKVQRISAEISAVHESFPKEVFAHEKLYADEHKVELRTNSMIYRRDTLH